MISKLAVVGLRLFTRYDQYYQLHCMQGILQSGTVAVKRLSLALGMDEKNFNQEVSSLIRVKHRNIVRFLGYCVDTQGKVEKYMGKMVIADVRQRLLCFAFMPNGSLDKRINGMLFLFIFMYL